MGAQNWTEMEERLLVNAVITTVKNGGTLESSFEVASTKTKKSIDACEKRWYKNLHNKYREKIAKIKSEVTPDTKELVSWSRQEDLMLANAVAACVKNGKSIQDAFVYVSKKLKRSRMACQHRWYNVVSKIEVVAAKMKELKKGAK